MKPDAARDANEASPGDHPAEHTALDRLAERIRRDLDVLDYPRRQWLDPRRTSAGQPIHDVVVVGGGQGGLAAAFALMRERVPNVLVVDENPLGKAGPWLRFARMQTLRTPKHLTGPDLGIPSLTLRAWWEAQHGQASWSAVGCIPKEAWAAYLTFYRETLGIPLRAETRVGALRWDARENAWRVPCSSADAARRPAADVIFARRVVLATGIDGSGTWYLPAQIRESLPEHLYAHTSADINFAALAGKRVAVLGAGASAFDNAATALEHGARAVDLFFRRETLVKVNAYRWAESAGFLRHFADLPDDAKWRFMVQIMKMGQLPPAETYRRASRNPAFRMHPGAAWRSIDARGGAIRIETDGGELECDFVIAATGFVTDLAKRPELQAIEGAIARWSDRYTPPPGERHEDLLRHPYLGPSFEFTERQPGTAPYLAHVFNYTFGGLLSLGLGGASISGMKHSIPRLIAGITRSLFVEDSDAHFESLCTYAEEEI